MKGFIARHRPSPSMAVALLALAIALGGTSYAAIRLPKNSVGTKQIKNSAVTGAKVKDASLFSNDFAPGQIPKGPKGDTGPRGLTGARGLTGPMGPSNGYYATTRTKTPISGTDFDNPFVTLTGLPPGSYVLNGHLTAVKAEAGLASVRCGIKTPTADSAGNLHYPGQAVAVSGDTTPVAAVAVSLAVKSTTTFNATLYCFQQNAGGASIEEGRLEAIRVGTLTVQ